MQKGLKNHPILPQIPSHSEKKKYAPNQTETFSNVILVLNRPLESTLVLCSLSFCSDILIKI